MEKFTILPNGINHNESPVFIAKWFSGDIKAPEDSLNSFYHEGSGQDDQILIYSIEWQSEPLSQEEFNSLMDKAISAIDNWIADRF